MWRIRSKKSAISPQLSGLTVWREHFARAFLFRSKDAGEDAMDFQVNDETYFLNLDDERREWHVFVTTPNGAKSVPVYIDDEKHFDDAVIVVEDKRKQKIVN
jgi:hypothetical protein